MDPLALIGAKKKTKKGNEASLEVTIDLAKPTRSTFPCFDFNEIKKKADYHDGLSDSDDERFHDPEALRMFKILQEKYATKRDKKGRKRNIGCVDDYIDKAAGYDLEDAFIDDSEAFDTLVPSTMEPIKRGFYVNREKLEFRPVAGAEASDSEDEEEQPPEPKKRKVKPVEDVSNQPSTSAAVAAPAPAAVARLSNGAPPTARLSNGAAPSRMAGQPPSKKAAIQSSAGPTKKPTTVTAPPAKPTVATDTEKDDEELDTTAPADESRGELANVSSDVSTSSASKAPYSDELVNRIRAFQGSVQQGKARQRLSLDQVKLIQRVDDQMLSEEMRPHAKSKVMDQLAEYAGLNKVTLTKLLQKHKEYLQNGSPMETDWESSLVPAKPKQAAPINPQTAQLHNLLESLKANKSAEAQDLLKSFIKSKAPGSPLSSKLPASVIASLSSAQKPGLTTAQKPSSSAAQQKPGPSNASQKHAQSVFLKPPQPSPTPQSKTTPATPPVSSKPPVLTAQKPQPAPKPQSAQKPVQKAISSKSSTSSSSLDGIKTFRDFKVRFDALKSKQKDLAPGVAVHRVTELIMSTLQCDKKDASVCAIKAFSGGDHYKMVMLAVEDYMKKQQEEAAKQAANGSSKNAPLSTIRAENVQNTMHNAAKPIKKPSTNSAPPKLTRMEPETITIDDSDEVQASTSKASPQMLPTSKTPSLAQTQAQQQQQAQNLFQSMAAMGFLGLNLNNKDVMSQFSALHKATTSPGTSVGTAQNQLSLQNQLMAQMIQSKNKLNEDKLLMQIREEHKKKAEEERKKREENQTIQSKNKLNENKILVQIREEHKKKADEERKKKEQEELMKVLEKRKKREDQQRQEEERKRKEQEELVRRQKQIEEENRKRVEEQRRKEAEEQQRKIQEEARRQEQMRQKLEEQRRVEEFRRRQEEERRCIEERRRILEAEQRKRQEEEQRRQEEMRQLKLMEEQRRLELERRQQEEFRRRQEEEQQLRVQEEQRRLQREAAAEQQRRLQQQQQLHMQQQQQQQQKQAEERQRQQRVWQQQQQLLAQQQQAQLQQVQQQQMLQMQQRLQQQQQQQQQQPANYQQQQMQLQMQQMIAQQQTAQAQQQQQRTQPQPSSSQQQQQPQYSNQSQYYHQNLQNGHNWPGN